MKKKLLPAIGIAMPLLCKRTLFLLIFIVCSTAVWSQKTINITKAEKKALVDSLKKRLERYYVYPDKGKEMSQYLSKRWAAKAYDAISDYVAFVDTLARDVATAHKDPHLGIYFDPAHVYHLQNEKTRPRPTPGSPGAEDLYPRKQNYGFQKAEILPGNIGYLSIPAFSKANQESKATLAAAFEFLAYTDAMIIDLRSNSGGQPSMVQELLSYFFDKPILTSSTYDRELDTTFHNYALETVKGKKVPNKKLYILTSENTFSAGEAFAYFMKNQQRAVIVGEVTAGAAHGEKPFIVNDKVVIYLPYERGIDAVTKTDWEGVGVQPDVAIKANKALAKAQQLIMENALPSVKDPGEKFALEWALVAVKSELSPSVITDALKKEYTGVYGERKIFMEGDQLMFQRGNGPKRKLFALSEDTFELEGVDDYRLKFVRNASGKVEKLVGMLNNGVANEFLRAIK